jgi:DNA polymerase-3 subunit gamma/tau
VATKPPGSGASGERTPAPVRRDPAPAPPEFVPPEFTGRDDEPPDDLPPDGLPPDEPSPDDRAVRQTELTGMDLIQRELGGQVIGEIEG